MAVHAKNYKGCYWSCTLIHFTELDGKLRVIFFLKTISNYNTNVFQLIIEANQIIYILNFLCLPLLHNRWRCIYNTLQHSILPCLKQGSVKDFYFDCLKNKKEKKLEICTKGLNFKFCLLELSLSYQCQFSWTFIRKSICLIKWAYNVIRPIFARNLCWPWSKIWKQKTMSLKPKRVDFNSTWSDLRETVKGVITFSNVPRSVWNDRFTG